MRVSGDWQALLHEEKTFKIRLLTIACQRKVATMRIMAQVQGPNTRLASLERLRACGSLCVRQALIKMLGVLYFVTAVGKGAQVERTAIAIRSVLGVGEAIAEIAVVGLVLLELFLASLFLSGYRVRFASAFSALVGVIFLVWHFVVWATSVQPDCGCGSPLVLKELLGNAGAGLSLAIVVTGVSVALRFHWFSGARDGVSGRRREKEGRNAEQ